MKFIKIFFKSIIIFFLFLSTHVVSDILNKIEITGNDRISDESIKSFISVKMKDEINDVKLNNIKGTL